MIILDELNWARGLWRSPRVSSATPLAPPHASRRRQPESQVPGKAIEYQLKATADCSGWIAADG